MAADGPWLSQQDMEEVYPVPSPSSNAASEPTLPIHNDPMLDTYRELSWLMQFVDDSDIVEPPQKKKRKSNGHASSSAFAKEDASEAQCQLSEIIDALHQGWNELSDTSHHKGKDFATTLTGGAWTHRNPGVDYDAFKGHATSANSSAWCRQFVMQMPFGASIRILGKDTAMQLADTWCRNMQAYYDAFEAEEHQTHGLMSLLQRTSKVRASRFSGSKIMV